MMTTLLSNESFEISAKTKGKTIVPVPESGISVLAFIGDISSSLQNYYMVSQTSSASELSEAFSNCLSEVPSTYKTYDSTLSSLSDDGYALVSQLSVKADISALDKKITIDDRISGVFQQIDLSIIKLSTDEYEQIVGTSSILSNALYIVEGSFEDAYGQQIKNVAPGTDLSDAVTLEQLSNALNDIQIPADLSAFTNSPGYLLASQLSALQSISSPKYSVNSICDTLISVLNILKGLQ